MSTSSRSSSEAASSLRLVKMSVTPRAIVVDERDRPEAQALEPALLRRGRRGDGQRSWGLGRRLDNQLGFTAATERRRIDGRNRRLAAAEPAAQQT